MDEQELKEAADILRGRKTFDMDAFDDARRIVLELIELVLESSGEMPEKIPYPPKEILDTLHLDTIRCLTAFQYGEICGKSTMLDICTLALTKQKLEFEEKLGKLIIKLKHVNHHTVE